MEVRLLVIAILGAVVSAGVGIACLIRIDQLESSLRLMHRAGGRTARLPGKGRLVDFPGQPRRPK
jgi:hypothetical protein